MKEKNQIKQVLSKLNYLKSALKHQNSLVKHPTPSKRLVRVQH